MQYHCTQDIAHRTRPEVPCSSQLMLECRDGDCSPNALIMNAHMLSPSVIVPTAATSAEYNKVMVRLIHHPLF